MIVTWCTFPQGAEWTCAAFSVMLSSAPKDWTQNNFPCSFYRRAFPLCIFFIAIVSFLPCWTWASTRSWDWLCFAVGNKIGKRLLIPGIEACIPWPKWVFPTTLKFNLCTVFKRLVLSWGDIFWVSSVLRINLMHEHWKYRPQILILIIWCISFYVVLSPPPHPTYAIPRPHPSHENIILYFTEFY
jgi:hypothetical protein